MRREWHSLDHVGLSESYSTPEGSSAEWPFDYFHVNSIDQLPDGATTLISARNTWALYELNTITGQITLRVGGKRSERQAAPRRRDGVPARRDACSPTGRSAVFDNGAVPKVHPQSRAIVLSVDPRSRPTRCSRATSTRAALSSGSQGNMQTLPGGRPVRRLGLAAVLLGIHAGGQLLYDAHWHGSYQTYRAYRFPWNGHARRPRLRSRSRDQPAPAPLTVYASWNGATEVASWRVLAGSSPAQLVAGGERRQERLRDRDHDPRRRALRSRRGRKRRRTGPRSLWDDQGLSGWV